MKSDDADMDLDQAAAIYDALGHPIRLAILRALQKEKTLPLAELRKRVSDLYIEVDTRNVQFHLYKMQMAELVKSERIGGRESISLLRNVGINVRKA